MVFIENLRVVKKTVLVGDCVRLWAQMQISLMLQLLAEIAVHPASTTDVVVTKLLKGDDS